MTGPLLGRLASHRTLLNWLFTLVLGPLCVYVTAAYHLNQAIVNPILPYWLVTLLFMPPLEAGVGYLVAISYSTWLLIETPHIAPGVVAGRIIILLFFFGLIVHVKQRLQQRAQERLRLLEGAERQRAEQRFRGLLESAPDAIAAMGAEGCIVLVNGQMEQLFGYQRDELLGQPVEMLLPHDLHEQHVQHRARYYGDPRTRPMGSGLELRARRKDGSEFPVEISLSPHQANGEMLVTAVIRDITERKRLEDERQRAEVAERAVRDRDEFLSVAAHELKTPLTSLSGFAQVLLRYLRNSESVDPERLGRALCNIETQVEKVNRLVDQLLDVTRLDAGRLVLERCQTDLCALLREVVDTAQAQTSQHRLVVQAPPALCVWVDPLRLEQVLTNLLGNAIKYSPEGGTITCTLTADAGGDAVRIAVRDQGIGIPPEQRAHIFDRFYQAHASSYRSGLGLGLYISQQIVTLHGGQLTADFPPEGGSRFVIRLPRGGERKECPAPGAVEPLPIGALTVATVAEGGRHDDTQAYPGH